MTFRPAGTPVDDEASMIAEILARLSALEANTHAPVTGLALAAFAGAVTIGGVAVPKVGFGTFSGTTTAAGALVVTHGLGWTPSVVVLQPTSPNGGTTATRFTAWNIPVLTSVSFTIGRCVSQDGTLLGSTAVAGRWLAAG